jgi:hypothetical protein
MKKSPTVMASCSHSRSHSATKATYLIIAASASATGRTLLTLDDSQASIASEVGIAVNPQTRRPGRERRRSFSASSSRSTPV